MTIASFALWSRDPSSFDRARGLLADERRFDTGLEAAETLAGAAQHLEGAVDVCRDEDRGVRCQGLSAALGYAQVLAPWVLDCTDPGRHEARARMLRYLDTVDDLASDAPRVPGPPPLPSCRG